MARLGVGRRGSAHRPPPGFASCAPLPRAPALTRVPSAVRTRWPPRIHTNGLHASSIPLIDVSAAAHAGNWFWVNLSGTFGSWAQALTSIVDQMGATAADKQALFHDTAARVYKIAPSPSPSPRVA